MSEVAKPAGASEAWKDTESLALMNANAYVACPLGASPLDCKAILAPWIQTIGFR